MKKLILTVLIISCIVTAEKTKEYPACVSEDTYHMMMNASMSNDETGLAILIREGSCFWMRAGMQALIVDRGSLWGNKPMKIRIRSEAVWATVYTNQEGVQ